MTLNLLVVKQMKNNAYWTRRANLRMEEYHKNSDSTIQKISAAYDKAIKDINEDINKIFYKYQLDSGLPSTEVRESLNSKISKGNQIVLEKGFIISRMKS